MGLLTAQILERLSGESGALSPVGKLNFPASGVGAPAPEKKCTGFEPLTIESVSFLSFRALSEVMRHCDIIDLYMLYNSWTCKLFVF